jgi:Fe-S cluster assembly scaffold protein SufB
MSRSAILSATIDNQLKIADIETAEEAGAVLTLTRTAVQAITTAGTTIVWQSEIRGYQITWSGADITIPATGWYHISVALQHGALNDNLIILVVNSINVQFAPGIGDVNRDVSAAHFMRHFTESDVVQIRVLPSANVNVNVIAENSNSESPILNIVQLSGEVDV